jgi:hypothetical protein
VIARQAGAADPRLPIVGRYVEAVGAGDHRPSPRRSAAEVRDCLTRAETSDGLRHIVGPPRALSGFERSCSTAPEPVLCPHRGNQLWSIDFPPGGADGSSAATNSAKDGAVVGGPQLVLEPIQRGAAWSANGLAVARAKSYEAS